MHRSTGLLVLTLLALACVQGCSRSAAPAAGSDATPAKASAKQSAGLDAKAIQALIDAQNKPRPHACAMVTPQEMSKILGATVNGELHEGSVDKTECIYKPADAVSPYVELTVEWGEGESAMGAAGAMGKVEPGIANPYAGIGDQAIAVGTGLMIKTGDDLVTIMFSGVGDAPAKARKIFDTVKPRI